MTSVLESPVLEETTTDNPDKMAHYFSKENITESAIMGTPVEAVCGYVTVITRTEDSLPVCARCDYLFHNTIL